MSTTSISRFGAILLALVCVISRGGWADEPKTADVDPREFGFDIPKGPLVSGHARRAATTDAGGMPTLAKIHVEVGVHRILMLPDGSLVARKSSEAPDSDRPFVPLKVGEIASELTANGPLKSFSTSTTRRYAYIYNTSESFALVTKGILESMYPGVVAYAKAQRIETVAPETPLVVVMFRTEDEFQKYRRMPPGVAAYYHVVSNQVVLYEESKLSRVKPELAIGQAISTIAHEGVHQVLHNIGVQQRLSVWPMWLSEGLAEYFAPTSVGEKLKWKGAGQVNDLRMCELEQYLQQAASDAAPGQTIDQTVLAARLSSAGYASAWALTHFLAKNQRAELYRYIKEVSRLGPLEGNYRVVGPGLVRENLTLFKKHFGDDTAEMERRLIAHLKKQPYTDPFADWPTFAAMFSTKSGKNPRREAQLFHSQTHADNWLKGAVGKLPEGQRDGVQTTVREFPNRPAADAFMRQWLMGK